MASPHPSAVDRLRISATTGLPLASPRLRLHRGAEISFNSSRSPAVAPGARTDDSDDSAQRVPLTGLQARANASPRTPSGFGLSHAHPGPFPTHLAKSPQPEFVKGHRVLKISTLISRYPCVIIATAVLIVMSIVWLMLMPSHLAVQDYITPRSAAVVEPAPESQLQQQPVVVETPQLVVDQPEPPPDMPSMQHPDGGIIMPPRKPPTASELAAAAALLAQEAERQKQLLEQQQQQQQQPVVPVDEPKVTPVESPKQPDPPKESEPTKQPETPKQQEQPVTPPVHVETPVEKPVETKPKPAPVDEQPVVPPTVADPTKPVPEALPKDNSALLQQSDLDESALRCQSTSTAPPAECDWTWGPPSSRSGSSEDHPREDLSEEGDWTKPQDFYTYEAGVHVSGEGAGALVRIHLRDLCCAAGASKMPLSYFRITAHGTAQAASNPPLALGPMPAAMGRGHQAVHLSKRGWGADVDLRSASIDESRVLQTFLYLPDAGSYAIQVRLLHYNVSSDMVAENYRMNSKAYNDRPGLWVNGLLRNARGETQTALTIPREAGVLAPERGSLPLCGGEGSGRLGGRSPTGTSFGMPLAGRWVFRPPKVADPAVGWEPSSPTPRPLASYPRRWLVERSEWVPYFCRLDHDVPFAAALEKVGWMHFTGDSNIRHMFFYVCEMANGTLLSVDPQRVPRFLDPPHLCIGPSSGENVPDKESGLEVGSGARWVLSYTNWFWGKHQTLNQPAPETRFAFREQCGKFVEQNQTGLFYGWPHCNKAPPFIQDLSGPGLTYFGWGSHAAELGSNALTGEYLAGGEAFGLEHFRHHPAIFPLTTANTPQRIPDKFGRQQCMRNNERVHASNVHVVDAIMSHRLEYATRTEGGAASPANWLPVFDLFSPTHAAYEDLAVDAVHFDYFFSYQEPRWLMHYIAHAPNWGSKPKAKAT